MDGLATQDSKGLHSSIGPLLMDRTQRGVLSLEAILRLVLFSGRPPQGSAFFQYAPQTELLLWGF